MGKKQTTYEELFVKESVMVKYYGKFFIAFIICFLLFYVVVGMPGLLSLIFSWLISYLFIKYIINKKSNARKRGVKR